MALDHQRRAQIKEWAESKRHSGSGRTQAEVGMILDLLAEIDRLARELDLADEALADCAEVITAPPFPKEFLESGQQTRHHAERDAPQ